MKSRREQHGSSNTGVAKLQISDWQKCSQNVLATLTQNRALVLHWYRLSWAACARSTGILVNDSIPRKTIIYGTCDTPVDCLWISLDKWWSFNSNFNFWITVGNKLTPSSTFSSVNCKKQQSGRQKNSETQCRTLCSPVAVKIDLPSNAQQNDDDSRALQINKHKQSASFWVKSAFDSLPKWVVAARADLRRLPVVNREKQRKRGIVLYSGF